jgi:hypothetical protein
MKSKIPIQNDINYCKQTPGRIHFELDVSADVGTWKGGQ